MIDFRFTNLVSEGRPIGTEDLLVRAGADFEIVVGERVLYFEIDFPVIELAAALAHWSDVAAPLDADFEFDSMSAPEPGWVQIRRESAGWRLGSLHQEYPEMGVFTTDEVESAVRRFTRSLARASREQLNLDLKEWVPASDWS